MLFSTPARSLLNVLMLDAKKYAAKNNQKSVKTILNAKHNKNQMKFLQQQAEYWFKPTHKRCWHVYLHTHTHARTYTKTCHTLLYTHTHRRDGRSLLADATICHWSAAQAQHSKERKKKLESNQKIVEQLPMQPLPCGRRRLLQSCCCCCCCVPKSTTKHIAHGNNTKKQPCKPSQARPRRAESSRAEPKPNALSFTINARPTVARRSRSWRWLIGSAVAMARHSPHSSVGLLSSVARQSTGSSIYLPGVCVSVCCVCCVHACHMQS